MLLGTETKCPILVR